MLIDWFTVGAQAVNFLILVWLMKRFLYKPILQTIDTRDKRIAKDIADAEAKQADAQKEHEEFQHKNDEFDKQRTALLDKAMSEANGERLRLLEKAREAADALGLKRQEALKSDAHNLHQAISQRAQEEVFAIVRKTLKDLATTDLEERLGQVFIRRLQELDGPTKAGLVGVLKSGSEPAILRSAFDLPEDQRAVIQNALNETFSIEVRLRFETAPKLISGIEFSVHGQKVAWSISDYLMSLERGVAELLKEKEKPIAKPKLSPGPKADSSEPEDKSS